jgi:superfamily I DNA/RNA helicase|tara:strand:- start:399 stop:1889 length:1491 start_codon:yes stop_codon:yes gene_type:complete
MKTIVIGPPGTGKTTTLLNEVDKYLKQTDPNKIGYFSFTQKAAYEARDRAMDKFNYSEDDLPYFRTLHSLAFRRLGIKKENVMQRRHYEDLGKKINMRLDYNEYDKQYSGLFTTGSDILRIIHLARLKGITPEQQYNLKEHTQNIRVKELKEVSHQLKEYKRLYNLIDFTDMIENFIKSDASPKFDVVFIDEAQDLSQTQWTMAKSIWDKTGDVFIAGDDDQAIFRWAGADVDSFITQKGKLLSLTQSYRVPRVVHDVAMSMVKRISNRIHKQWAPKTDRGLLSYYHNVNELDMSSGNWMILARTKYMLNDIEKTLHARGFHYKNKFKDNYEKDLYHAVIDWEKLRDKEYLSYEQIQRISSYMSQNNFEKKSLDYMDKDASYDMQGLKERKWLRTDKVWFEAFDEAPEKKVRYIRRMRENGEKLNKEPRILLSTIHGVKGGECDNVVLLTDLSLNTQRNFERNPDDENRLFYVGATRTKNHLHIIRPKDIYKGYKI